MQEVEGALPEPFRFEDPEGKRAAASAENDKRVRPRRHQPVQEQRKEKRVEGWPYGSPPARKADAGSEATHGEGFGHLATLRLRTDQVLNIKYGTTCEM